MRRENALDCKKRVFPHLLRHSDAIIRLRKTGNPKALQYHLGHNTPSMTLRYLSTLTQEDVFKEMVEGGGMKNKTINKRVILLLVMCVFVASCATTPVYKEVFKDRPTYNQKEFSVSKEVLYQAALKAICSKGFIIEEDEAEKGLILAKRSFQRGKRTIVLALQAKITDEREDKSTLYLNALQTTERFFVADRTRFFFWIIPLPGGGGKEATKVKEGEKIIEDKKFYQDFFSAIEEEIEDLQSRISNEEDNRSNLSE